MNQISSKVYYNMTTGEVLLITNEMQGDIWETTQEYDFSLYEQLQNEDINNTDFITLPYGSFSAILNNHKSYVVDVTTKQLNVEYYTNEEIEAFQNMMLEREQVGNRVNDISTYLTDQTSESITSIEDFILQTELNKITEGMS